MTKREAERQTHQMDTLRALGFTRDEAEALRRISMTLRRWYERECGDERGGITRDETTGKPYWLNARTGHRSPIADRETGAEARLKKILARVNVEERHGDLPDGSGADRAGALGYYIQTDPRGAALYIIRPGDVPAGATVDSCYSRGICVY